MKLCLGLELSFSHTVVVDSAEPEHVIIAALRQGDVGLSIIADVLKWALDKDFLLCMLAFIDHEQYTPFVHVCNTLRFDADMLVEGMDSLLNRACTARSAGCVDALLRRGATVNEPWVSAGGNWDWVQQFV